jgi:uncharacterized protein YjiS (DUF1127 family)
MRKLMMFVSIGDPRLAAPPQPRRLLLALRSSDLAATLRVWCSRHRQRSALGELDDHLLKDIGVTRDEALRETAKPFWRR